MTTRRKRGRPRSELKPLFAAIRDLRRRDRQALDLFSRLLSEHLGFAVAVVRRRPPRGRGRPPMEPPA